MGKKVIFNFLPGVRIPLRAWPTTTVEVLGPVMTKELKSSLN